MTETPSLSSMPHIYAVRRLSLTAFRNYADLRMEVTERPVVLFGGNGAGKTNIIEALSLLAPGRGLRRAALGEVQMRAADTPWAVAAEIACPAGFVTVSTGLDPADLARERRAVRIDGKPVKGQAALAETVSLVWLTPEMDRILAEGASARRKFLDRLVFGFDPAHAGRVNRYEQAMRERLRLLRDGGYDALWLNSLEDSMARTGIAIAAARVQMVAQLQRTIENADGAFPRAGLELRGLAEEDLRAGHPALLVEDKLRAALAAARRADADTGTSTTGPQRSDLLVTHGPKNMPLDLCSTGEQKALLITIFLAHMRLLANWRGIAPLVLLDDIAAHLDTVRRRTLYDALLATGAQFWLTGTDRDVFAPLEHHATFFMVKDGRVEKISP